MAPATGPGEAIGAWAGGAIYDLTVTYLWAFGFVVTVLALGAWSLWQVRLPQLTPGGGPSRATMRPPLNPRGEWKSSARPDR